MHVLIVYAHHNPQSFTHAVLEEVERGLRDAGHDLEVIDLYAEHFDPVFSMQDGAQFVHPTAPERIAGTELLRQAVVDAAGNPVKRILARRWARGRSRAQLIELFQRNRPDDVRAQQAKVAAAEAIVFIAPVYWMGFPAILKGWMERVFAYGFAYTLDERGWADDLAGRQPLLTQRKGLIITPTFFTQEEYDKGWRQAMDTVLCDWSLKMAGVQETEHVYFHAVAAADETTRKDYLAQAYRLGRDLA